MALEAGHAHVTWSAFTSTDESRTGKLEKMGSCARIQRKKVSDGANKSGREAGACACARAAAPYLRLQGGAQLSRRAEVDYWRREQTLPISPVKPSLSGNFHLPCDDGNYRRVVFHRQVACEGGGEDGVCVCVCAGGCGVFPLVKVYLARLSDNMFVLTRVRSALVA